MFETFNFNVFKENLHEIVYGSYENRGGSEKRTPENQSAAAFDKPIPQPVPDFWRPDFISKFINYKPLKSK